MRARIRRPAGWSTWAAIGFTSTALGTGSPTVVIDSGLGDWSASWSSAVQPEAARTSRVCTYDRAGMGYSEPGPLPRTAARFSDELHTLLQRADIPGPYVLAGHSSGGLTVRVFADAYPVGGRRGGADRLRDAEPGCAGR